MRRLGTLLSTIGVSLIVIALPASAVAPVIDQVLDVPEASSNLLIFLGLLGLARAGQRPEVKLPPMSH